jgi:putative hemolysin
MATPSELMRPALRSGAAKAFSVDLARSEDEILSCQRLRYEVFAEELGAALHTDAAGLDRDRFDTHCKHLMVRDNNTGEIVGTTRVLVDRDIDHAGMFYSQTEFDLTRVLAMGGSFLEIGRTCIHQDYRRGSALAVLWQGVARLMVLHDADYLIGCASISMADGGSYALSVMSELRKSHFAAEHLRVFPKVPLPRRDVAVCERVIMPPLLKGYLRSGAVICGEPCWDEAFNVADVFVLLDRNRLAERYVRHFVNRT